MTEISVLAFTKADSPFEPLVSTHITIITEEYRDGKKPSFRIPLHCPTTTMSVDTVLQVDAFKKVLKAVLI